MADKNLEPQQPAAPKKAEGERTITSKMPECPPGMPTPGTAEGDRETEAVNLGEPEER
jgi:hypothetical protein